VKDEQTEVDLHLANLEKIRQSIATKEKEITMLNQVKSDNELTMKETQKQLDAVETEIKEIEKFLVILDEQCTAFLGSFTSNQAARAQEISDTIQAKEVLAGMSEEGAAALAQLDHALQHVRKGKL